MHRKIEKINCNQIATRKNLIFKKFKLKIQETFNFKQF